MLKEICTLIEGLTGLVMQQDGLGILQVGHRLPNAPDRCVLIAETGGGATVPELPDRADVLIQAVGRGAPKRYFEARDIAWAVYQALHGTAGWTLPFEDGSGSYIVYAVDALAIPQYIGQDVDERHEFSVNFIFRMALGSCGLGGSGS